MDGRAYARQPWLWLPRNFCWPASCDKSLVLSSVNLWGYLASRSADISFILLQVRQWIQSYVMLRYEKGYRTASFDRDFNQSTMDFLTPAGFLHLARFYQLLPTTKRNGILYDGHVLLYCQDQSATQSPPQLWLHAPLWGSAFGWCCIWTWTRWWWWPQIAAHGGSHHGVLPVETFWMPTETSFCNGSVHRIPCFQGASNEGFTKWIICIICTILVLHHY